MLCACVCEQVLAEDLGWQFNAFAREAWKLVLLFILTELKRGFTYCLKEKAGIPVQHLSDAGGGSCSGSVANLRVFDLPGDGEYSITDKYHDVRNDVPMSSSNDVMPSDTCDGNDAMTSASSAAPT